MLTGQNSTGLAHGSRPKKPRPAPQSERIAGHTAALSGRLGRGMPASMPLRQCRLLHRYAIGPQPLRDGQGVVQGTHGHERDVSLRVATA